MQQMQRWRRTGRARTVDLQTYVSHIQVIVLIQVILTLLKFKKMLKSSFWDVGQICLSTYVSGGQFHFICFSPAFVIHLESSVCCLFEWGLNYRETVSTFSSSNELHVQLRCSCLACCESHPAIDVIAWWFYTAASNILLFMRMCFDLLCAHIYVCMCVQIQTVQIHLVESWAALCMCITYVYTHTCVHICVFMLLFVSVPILITILPLSVRPLRLSPFIAMIQRCCIQ